LFNINYTGYFEQDVPELERAFNEVMIDIRPMLSSVLPIKEVEEVGILISNLCCPDPRKRGFKKNVESGINQYSLERVISKLDMLAKKAEYKLI